MCTVRYIFKEISSNIPFSRFPRTFLFRDFLVHSFFKISSYIPFSSFWDTFKTRNEDPPVTTGLDLAEMNPTTVPFTFKNSGLITLGNTPLHFLVQLISGFTPILEQFLSTANAKQVNVLAPKISSLTKNSATTAVEKIF